MYDVDPKVAEIASDLIARSTLDGFHRSCNRAAATHDANDPSGWGKVGRNEPCPCGSGKRYKQCHGRTA